MEWTVAFDSVDELLDAVKAFESTEVHESDLLRAMHDHGGAKGKFASADDVDYFEIEVASEEELIREVRRAVDTALSERMRGSGGSSW